jgi:hypothetical protein
MTEKENKNMSKLPARTETNPPNTTYLRPRLPNDTLRDAVSLVANWQQPEPEHCNFKFEISPEAAGHNLGIIRGHQYDLDAALKAEGGTALRYCSEFKPPSILGLLLENHPLWDSISSSLSNGIKYPLERITCHARRRSIQQAIDRGNHKSARDQPETLVELLASDVHSGFALVPLPTRAIFKIPDAVLASVGIANQLTISDDGEVISKDRLTHDQAFKFGPETSLNNRMRMNEVNPVVFGWCLSRLLHYIVDLRRRHPHTKIFLMKTDWNRAFRRGHLSAPDAAASSCLATLQTFLLSLRMAFGGRANPSEWSNISESACDLVNALQTLPNFHPESYLHLIPAKIPTKTPLDEDIPFKQVGHLSVDIEQNDCGKSDIYLDDNIGIAPGLQDNVRRLSIIMPFIREAILGSKLFIGGYIFVSSPH